MYINKKNIFRNGTEFYKDGTIFKGTLRSTIKEAREEYCSQWGYKYHQCPKTIRRTFKEDYHAFKDRWGKGEVYVIINGNYEHEVNVGQFQVVVPVYEIENNVIKKIFREYRGWYPLSILNVTKVNKLPREGGDINPEEKIVDTIGKNGRDAQMFINLNGQEGETYYTDCESNNNMRQERANITGTGKPIINDYNYGYKYVDNTLLPAERPVIN